MPSWRDPLKRSPAPPAKTVFIPLFRRGRSRMRPMAAPDPAATLGERKSFSFESRGHTSAAK